MKSNIKKDYNMKGMKNKNNYNYTNNNKRVKVIQIDLDEKEVKNDEYKGRNNNINKNIKKNKKSEENYDMIEHVLNNLSKFNIDNNDDSF